MNEVENWWPSRDRWPEFPVETLNGLDYRGGASEALALLLLEDVVIALWAKDAVGSSTIALYVVCSDTFAYASADAEPLPPIGFGDDDPFWELYDMVRAHGEAASIAWCMKRRNCRPLSWAVARLKEADMWDRYGLDACGQSETKAAP